ncbi:MAG TPA: DUF5668 domain-containing protein [Flavobacteriaceae bacterium]|nr:DUF5668 domain-containing protein [Flavobacteriaceae bacterium]
MENKDEFKRKAETHFKGENWHKQKRLSHVAIGILVIVAGLLVLFRQMGLYIPSWILSWKMLLVAGGFVLLIKHNFKNTAGYIMVGVGVVFLIRDLGFTWVNSNLFWPIVIIGIGIAILARSVFSSSSSTSKTYKAAFKDVDSEDVIHVESIFGGVTKNIVSKNFRGGLVSLVFAGAKINLMRVDLEEEAVIDITCVFSGTKLIIPSGWKVKSEVSTIFGGLDDKRPIMPAEMTEESKTLVLRGDCIFGGIEISSYE